MSERSELDHNGQLQAAKDLAVATYTVDGSGGKTSFFTEAVTQFGLLGAEELVTTWANASGVYPKTQLPEEEKGI